MPEIVTLKGVKSQMVKTNRLQVHILTSGPKDGEPVIFLHGNFAAATYWEETMLALPRRFRGIAVDLRGYGWTEDKPIDATQGARDWSEDLAALIAALHLEKAHLVAWSLAASVAYRFIIDHGTQVLSATLMAPVSPYGFGSTKDAEGTPCYADFAGSGGGLVNAEFVKLAKAGDRSADNAFSPRNVMNRTYYKPPFRAAREDDFLNASLLTRIGPDRYPGDFVPSANWPNVAPGVWGPINAATPKYMAGYAQALGAAQPKPPILWIRGSHDAIVSDASMSDIGTLGKLGFVPGWPGDSVFPSQPMLGQTRAMLQKYAAQGGRFAEHVIQDTGHGPHIEKPAEFNALLHAFLG
jgi:pimeloyl-ACP methyl ester carboxylesterase